MNYYQKNDNSSHSPNVFTRGKICYTTVQEQERCYNCHPPLPNHTHLCSSGTLLITKHQPQGLDTQQETVTDFSGAVLMFLWYLDEAQDYQLEFWPREVCGKSSWKSPLPLCLFCSLEQLSILHCEF